MKENFLTFDLDCYPVHEEKYTNSTTLSNVNTLFVHFSVQVIYSFQCCSSTQQLFRTSTTYSFISGLFSYGTFLVGHDRNAYSLHTPYYFRDLKWLRLNAVLHLTGEKC